MDVKRSRVLVVDDSSVARQLLVNALKTDPAVEVAGTATNGRAALAKIPDLQPDVVTLDVEMPDLDGLATLSAMRRLYPRLPIIMVSAHTVRGAAATVEALTRGASDYVTKPLESASAADSIRHLGEQLIPKIKALAVGNHRRSPQAAVPRAPLAPVRTGPVNIIAIGASTGGPEALGKVLSALPADLPVPVVVVQHMPPIFTRQLADHLNLTCALPVREAEPGMPIRPGEVTIAPGGVHLSLGAGEMHPVALLTHEPPVNYCRPAVDILFRSVVRHYGSGVLGVVLTGMGQDGLEGCREIRRQGGAVIVQDQASSVVWGMPGAVYEAGLATQVADLTELPRQILRLVAGSRRPTAEGA